MKKHGELGKCHINKEEICSKYPNVQKPQKTGKSYLNFKVESAIMRIVFFLIQSYRVCEVNRRKYKYFRIRRKGWRFRAAEYNENC